MDDSKIVKLTEELKHSQWNVRYHAVVALGDIKDPSAVLALCDSLKDSSVDVRVGAAIALGDIKDPIAFPALCEALKDSWSFVRQSAAEALGKIGILAVFSLFPKHESCAKPSFRMRIWKPRSAHRQSSIGSMRQYVAEGFDA